MNCKTFFYTSTIASLLLAQSILNKQAADSIHEGPGARFIDHDFYNKIG